MWRRVVVGFAVAVGAVALVALGVGSVHGSRASSRRASVAAATPPARRAPAARELKALAARLQARDPEERWRATLALVDAGAPAVPHLLALLARADAVPPVGPPGLADPEPFEGAVWIAAAHARYVLEQVLPDALPELVACVEDEKLCPGAIEWLGRYGALDARALPYLLALLDEHPRDVALALGHMGERAGAAAPALAALLDDPEAGYAAATNLPRLGEAAVAPIIAALANGRHAGLLDTLHELGPHAAAAVPVLVKLLASPDAALRRDVIWCLARIGPPARAAVPALVALAEGRATGSWPSTGTRASAAVQALLRIGIDDETAGRLLLHLVREKRAMKPEDVARLARARPDAGPAVAALLTRVAWSAPEVVAAFGPAVVPDVIPYLRSKDPRVRRLACDTLDWLGPAAAGATEAVRPLLADPDETVRFRAARVLAAIGPAARHLLGEVEAHLHDPSPIVRLHGAATSYRMTGDPRRAAETCFDVWQHEPKYEMWALAELVDYGPSAAVVTRLAEIAFAPGELAPVAEGQYSPGWADEYRRAEATALLAQVDELPPAVLARMPELLGRGIDVRAPAALALQRHGVREAEVLPVLIEAVRPVTFRRMCGRYTRSHRLRRQAIDALAEMGAVEAIPVIRAVRDEPGEVGEAVTAALRRLAAAPPASDPLHDR